MNSDIRPIEAEAYVTDERSRTPLKFGGVVMDQIKYVHVRVLSSDRIVDDVVLVALPGGFHTADQIRAAAQQVRAQTGTVMIHE